jgi:hypothetical protein
MTIPTSRALFKEWCLKKLGKPVITINVSDDQVDDRIDEALKYYYDYHFDGTEKTYYKYQLTQPDIDAKSIPAPENLLGVVGVFPVLGSYAGSNIFNIQYQIALNEIWSLTSIQLTPYYMAMEHLALINELFVGNQRVRFNRHTDKIYIDMDWKQAAVGKWIVVEGYMLVDPDTYTDAWSDRWLQLYATAKIKEQWGNNLSKFTGMQLPGGVQFNGQQIKEEALAEIKDLEARMITEFSLPVEDMIG